jgi:NAD(P)-dependent dehydrogenase (short-subunit alcohol dehydrogenase family)
MHPSRYKKIWQINPLLPTTYYLLPTTYYSLAVGGKILSDQKKKILITGASGLLGRGLVKEFLKGDFFVLAQYHSNQPIRDKNCQWLWADFSDLHGIRDFLDQNRDQLEGCGFLVNNYGPITSKPVSDLTAEDFYFDFHHNVVTVFEITDFFIKQGWLRAVVNLGFEFIGQQRAYKKILTYAAAKNALHLLTMSFQKQYPGIRFHMVSPPTLQGAEVRSKSGNKVSPESIAKKVYELILKYTTAI